jgi:hypothetical protein
MKCPNCGFEVENEKACPICGTILSDSKGNAPAQNQPESQQPNGSTGSYGCGQPGNQQPNGSTGSYGYGQPGNQQPNGSTSSYQNPGSSDGGNNPKQKNLVPIIILCAIAALVVILFLLFANLGEEDKTASATSSVSAYSSLSSADSSASSSTGSVTDNDVAKYLINQKLSNGQVSLSDSTSSTYLSVRYKVNDGANAKAASTELVNLAADFIQRYRSSCPYDVVSFTLVYKNSSTNSYITAVSCYFYRSHITCRGPSVYSTSGSEYGSALRSAYAANSFFASQSSSSGSSSRSYNTSSTVSDSQTSVFFSSQKLTYGKLSFTERQSGSYKTLQVKYTVTASTDLNAASKELYSLAEAYTKTLIKHRPYADITFYLAHPTDYGTTLDTTAITFYCTSSSVKFYISPYSSSTDKYHVALRKAFAQNSYFQGLLTKSASGSQPSSQTNII